MVMAKKKAKKDVAPPPGLVWTGFPPLSLSTQTTFQGKRGREKRGRKTGGERMEEAVFFFRRGIRPQS